MCSCRWRFKYTILSATPGTSVLFQLQGNGTFAQGVQDHFRTLSVHRVYLSPTAVDRTQMETIPRFIWRRAVWAERWKLAGIPESVQLKSTISNIFGRGWMRGSASKFNTCKMRVDQKDQVITLGVLTYCEKSLTPQPIQSFHKQCEKASSDLSSISVVSREAVSHAECLSHRTQRRTVCRCRSLLSPRLRLWFKI